ncbi:hypothetical protein VKT23_020077 [Stygiomarasmius scandens]|uniref:Mediator complex subunit 8 n=1 Tax=Marasmiellus scandens TaxID=2682957 RepID=A0ABR1IJS9_9AGAR
MAEQNASPEGLFFDPSTLPVAQLESLRFKANQIIDSIQTLQRTIDSHPAAMPAWPDILSKYTILLSQTHSFSTSLTSSNANAPKMNGVSAGGGSQDKSSPFEKIVLHPRFPMTDAQLDTDVIPLLRNIQTIDVLNTENETVRRLSEHMVTRGSVGVLGGTPLPPPPGGAHAFGGSHLQFTQRKPEYEDVLRECEEIRGDHDRRADRAIRAVMLLRDKFDWKSRVAVEVEEPEELEWDPRFGNGGQEGDVSMEGSVSDEDEVEGQLVSGDASTSPMQ